MQVKIEIAPEHTTPWAVIYTDRLTPEIQRALDFLQAKNSPVLAEQNGRTLLLTPQDVCMVRVENGETKLYTQQESYRSRKRLYELLDQLGDGFLQISKACAVNLSCIRSRGSGVRGKPAPENEKRPFRVRFQEIPA